MAKVTNSNRLRIRDLREDADLSQEFLSKKLHCTQQTYSRYELGQIKVDINTLTVLSIFYNTSIDYIVGLTDDPKPYPRSNFAKKFTKGKWFLREG